MQQPPGHREAEGGMPGSVRQIPENYPEQTVYSKGGMSMAEMGNADTGNIGNAL